jgi:hypothetical protein
MQIRLAVKQDEKQLREIFQENSSASVYSDSNDLGDLQNIEAHYFGKDGLFLVLEKDNQLKAAMGANRTRENTLAIRRYFAVGQAAQKELKSMLEICLQHAFQMDFQNLECPDQLAQIRAQGQP